MDKGQDHRLRSGQERRNQLARTKGPKSVVLFSSLLDGSSRIRVEQERRKLKRKLAATSEQRIVCETPKDEGLRTDKKLPSKPTSSSAFAAGNGQSLEAASLNQVKSRLSTVVGQVVPGLIEPVQPRSAQDNDFVDEEEELLLAQIQTPLSQSDWKRKVKLEFETLRQGPPAASSGSTPNESTPIVEEDIDWEEEDEGAENKAIVQEPKRIKISSDWNLPPVVKDQAVNPTMGELIKAAEREGGLDVMQRGVLTNGLLAHLSSVDLRPITTPPKYDPRDKAFALDALQRRRLLLERLLQQQKLLQEQQQKEEEEMKAKTGGTAGGSGAAAKPDAVSADAKKDTDKTKSSALAKLDGSRAQQRLTPGKNIPGRGPPKKDLLQRRYAQYGDLLRQFGILETADGAPLPAVKPIVAPPPPPTGIAKPEGSGEAEAQQQQQQIVTWRSQVSTIKHSEPAQELEGFEPQFRYSNPVKSFHRPSSFHKESNRIRVVADPTQFDQARTASASTSSGGGGGFGASGVRVDVVGASGTADAALNEIELSVSSRIWKKKDLSSKNGKICLMEYAEQFPMLLNGVGMHSQVINFYRKDPRTGFVPPKPEFGMFVGLEPEEFSPLMTRMDTGRVYRVMHNNMANVPLFEHRPSSSDFLLVRAKAKPGQAAGPTEKEVCLVRRINRTFTCGQVEPQIEIFPPSEPFETRTKFLIWLEKYMELHFATRLKRRDDMRIQFQTAAEMFSLAASEKMVERALSMVAEREAGGGLGDKRRAWAPQGASLNKSRTDLRRDLEEKRRACLNVLRPEDCCSWEQLQLGLFRLYQAGIEKVARSDVKVAHEAYKYMRELHKLRQQSHDALMETRTMNKAPFVLGEVAKQLSAVRYVVRELELTPWFLSRCFVHLHLRAELPFMAGSFPANTVLMVTGRGDPSGRSEMVSYLPKYPKKQQQQQLIHAAGDATLLYNDDEDEIYFDAAGKQKVRKKNSAQAQDKPKYGGTENDLRILAMEALGDILISLGVPTEVVNTIPRWDRTWLIEKFASSAQGPHLLGGAIARYARVPGSNNPSLEMAAEAALAASSLASTSDLSPADEYALRKKLEETDAFKQHRERVTKVFEREVAALSAGSAASNVTGTATSTMGLIENNNKPAQSKEDEDKPPATDQVDDELDDFAENLGESLFNNDSSDANKKVDLKDLAKEKQEAEKFIKEMQANKSKEATSSSSLSEPNEDKLFGNAPLTQQHMPGWQPFKVLKRTLIEIMPDGTERIRVEYHKSQETVKDFERRELDRKVEIANQLQLASSMGDSFARQRHHQTQLRLHSYASSGGGGGGVTSTSTTTGSAGGSASGGDKPKGKRGGPGRKPGSGAASANPSSAVKKKPGRKPSTPGSASGANGGGAADKEKQKAEEKARQAREAQQQNAAWYRFQVDKFGPDFYNDYQEDDLRLPSTMPRGRAPKSTAGGVARCTTCNLPGHNAQNPLCPLFDPSKQHVAPPTPIGGPGLKKKHLHQETTLQVPPGPLAELSKKLVRVLDVLVQHPNSYAFLHPVDHKTVPNYYVVIKHPIDLSLIRSKALQGTYKRKDAFLEALRLMRDNAGAFNGRESTYFRDAQLLLDVAERELDADGDEIGRLESQIPLQRITIPLPTSIVPEEAEEEIIEEEEEEVIEEDEEDVQSLVEPIEEGEEIIIEEEEEEAAGEEEEDFGASNDALFLQQQPGENQQSSAASSQREPLSPSSDLGGGEFMM